MASFLAIVSAASLIGTGPNLPSGDGRPLQVQWNYSPVHEEPSVPQRQVPHYPLSMKFIVTRVEGTGNLRLGEDPRMVSKCARE